MTVGEIAEVSRPSSLVWIEKDGVVLFTDWLYKIPEELKAETIKEFTFYPEIRHKDWKKTWVYQSDAAGSASRLSLFGFGDETVL